MFQWLNDRTGVITAWKVLRDWTVPSTKCVFRLIPAVVIFGFLLQGITGVLMWSHYSPSAQTAWESVYFFQYHIPFGWLIRGIHYFSAQFLVAILGIYLLGAIFRKAYKSPYEFGFWGAIILLLLAVCSCLTGDLMSWSLAGFSTTLIRVRFLQMIPGVGDTLFKLILGGPGPGFGTYTLTRFLVLHVMVFGGGFFLFLILWRFFDYRSGKMDAAGCNVTSSAACGCHAKPVLTYFWSTQFFWAMIASLLFLIAVLYAVTKGDLAKIDQPYQPQLGAELMSPADPAGSFDAARPEWSFRGLYYFSNLFPAKYKFYSIFVIPPMIVLFFFAIPILGKFKRGHVFNIIVTLVLLAGYGVMSYLSYRHDWHNPSYLTAMEDAHDLADRAMELAAAPEGIPPSGALTLMQNDPKVQGPVLFTRHCAVCHAFEPFAEEETDPDFKPYKHLEEANRADEPWRPTAPNLYKPIRAKWISGYLKKDALLSDHYFGNTGFKNGQMATFLKETLPELQEEIGDILMEDFKLDSFEQSLDRITEMLAAEANRNTALEMKGADLPADLNEEGYRLFGSEEGLGCDATGCHKFYGLGKTGSAPDLTGYMSREWLFGAIANINDTRFYGDKNEKMPVYYIEGSRDSTLTRKEVELLTDWLRGTWYRPGQ